MTFSIKQYPEQIAVVRFGPGSEVPGWAESSSIFQVTATATHTTVVCAARNVPTKARHVRSFTAFSVLSEHTLEDAGVLVPLMATLAEADISVVPVSTFEEPWLLVPQNDAKKAAAAWTEQGHTVAPAKPA
ncbi:ACT domain-containing protein [Nocardioides yefusunii]|uniref:ACT domain-containing protein n=1 Tax=Nocardioides yefusunii TaxID=2500546 RepID=A0ABW1QVP9_9ACTN|nr:ACT domain-containing protein [Nocardioides yefusunii]